MSIYDSSHPSAGDSDVTIRAKKRLQNVIMKGLHVRGYKCTIKFEVPATFEKRKYHADLGVLFRSRVLPDFYHFFIVEIDDPTHDTYKHELKDEERDEMFYNSGIATIRIKLSKIQGSNKVEDDDVLFRDFIWSIIHTVYIVPADGTGHALAHHNRSFAIELAENNKGTKCDSCDHKLYQHDLCGCSYRFTNKAKLKCNCVKPVFGSDD